MLLPTLLLMLPLASADPCEPTPQLADIEQALALAPEVAQLEVKVKKPERDLPVFLDPGAVEPLDVYRDQATIGRLLAAGDYESARSGAPAAPHEHVNFS